MVILYYYLYLLYRNDKNIYSVSINYFFFYIVKYLNQIFIFHQNNFISYLLELGTYIFNLISNNSFILSICGLNGCVYLKKTN